MSPGGANPLTSPVRFVLFPSATRHSACSSSVNTPLGLDPLHDAEHAPRHVIVDPGHLPRPPDQRDDREGAVGLDMKHMASVLPRVTGALLVAQHGRRGETALQFGSNEPSRRPPVLVPAHRSTRFFSPARPAAHGIVVLLSASLRLTVTNEVLMM